MSDVFWKRNKPDHDGVVWTDLRDANIKDWVLTYGEVRDKWLVLYKGYNGIDKYIDKADMPEEQLRNELKLQYLLTRGEANNVR